MRRIDSLATLHDTSNIDNFGNCHAINTTISAHLALIWAIHADIDGWRQWNPHVSFSDMCHGHAEKRKWTRVGTEFYWKKGFIPFFSVVTEVKPLSRISWINCAPGIKFKFISKYEETDSGTSVHVEALTDGFLSKVFFLPIKIFMAIAMSKWMKALKIETERLSYQN